MKLPPPRAGGDCISLALRTTGSSGSNPCEVRSCSMSDEHCSMSAAHCSLYALRSSAIWALTCSSFSSAAMRAFFARLRLALASSFACASLRNSCLSLSAR